jgi:transcriptional regulator with XRE-family HTH domain
MPPARSRKRADPQKNPVPRRETLAALARNLRAERRRQGLKQEDLASRAKLHRTYVSKLESVANPNPSLGGIDRLAKALKVTLSELLRDG